MATLNELFQAWSELNSQVQESFGQFDFSKIKEIRGKQVKIEDDIYKILKENAPENIKSMLPEDCGELEVGYETEGKIFYFVTVDEEDSTDDEIKLNAFTINVDEKVSLIEDFEMNE